MKNVLKDKKLLMLGGASYTPFVKEYADRMGFHLVAAGNKINEAMALYAEEFYIVEATSVDDVCNLVLSKNIDGIIALGNEDIIDCVIKVATKCNIKFYLNEEHWNNLQNKKNFKVLCKKFDIDVVEEHVISKNSTIEELKALPYPVVFKPVDSCGSKGITICYDVSEVRRAIDRASSFSRSNTYIVEQYMQCPEFIASYIFTNGRANLWMLGDRHMNTQQKGFGGLSNISVYPSRYSELYLNTVHSKMKELLREFGPKNGTMFIQGFVDGDRIRFFDPGMRFCGTLDTILYSHVCGVNPLHWMVNHSLTGVMATEEEIRKMDWNLHGKSCVQLSVLIHPGRISEIAGLEEVRNLNGVVSVIQLLEVGEEVTMVGTLQQVLARIHLVLDNKDKIKETIEDIYKLVRVLDDTGNDMKMPCVLDYDI